MDIDDVSETNRESFVINVKSLTKQLEEKMIRNNQSSDTQMECCCIFRIPTELLSNRNFDKKAYAPHAFSFGPFHYKNPLTAATNTLKLRFLDTFVKRTLVHLDDLVEEMTRFAKEARGYYAGSIGLDLEEFVQVMVIDGIFIVELFRKNSFSYFKLREKEDDLVFSMAQLVQYLSHDLVLLENQLPWKVLEMLFDKTRDCDLDTMPLVELALGFFGMEFSTPDENLLCDLGKSKHILDLLRNKLVLPCLARNGQLFLYEDSVMCSATDLEDSGIKLLAAMASESILDVRFKPNEGVLEVPRIVVDEITYTLFRNLVCLEYFCPNYDGFITSYAKLFDGLIQTSKDMKLLCDNGVVCNRLQLEKATRIFNQSYEDISGVQENYYNKVMWEVDRYRRQKKGYFYYVRRWRVYKRDLKRVYFSHPWAVISTVAASLMLILTFLQTFFTVIAYK